MRGVGHVCDLPAGTCEVKLWAKACRKRCVQHRFRARCAGCGRE